MINHPHAEKKHTNSLNLSLMSEGQDNFYSLDKTAASEIEIISPAFTEIFLDHSEKGMNRHYAECDWASLDAAITELGHLFDLDGDKDEWS